MSFTEQQYKELEDLFEKYYRRKYPTFQITGGGPSVEHQKFEYELTTNQGQILHFYEGGVGKLASNRSFEIYSGHDADVANGEVTGEGAIAIKLECRNGRIHIEAKSSDIETLGEIVRRKVLSETGVSLEWEIIRIGERTQNKMDNLNE